MGPNQIVDMENAMSANIYMIWATCGRDKDDKHDSTTELDTHANMAVIGIQATLFHTFRTAEVIAFSDEVENLESMPIVDASLAYELHKTLKTYHLILKNSLHIPYMQHN